MAMNLKETLKKRGIEVISKSEKDNQKLSEMLKSKTFKRFKEINKK